MAKNRNGRGPNKSAAIRQLLAESPKASMKDIVAQLAGRGIKVQPSLVYMVRSKQGKQRRRAKREQVRIASQKSGMANPIEMIVKVKALAMEAGGIGNLRLLVNVLAD